MPTERFDNLPSGTKAIVATLISLYISQEIRSGLSPRFSGLSGPDLWSRIEGSQPAAKELSGVKALIRSISREEMPHFIRHVESWRISRGPLSRP